LPALTWRVMSQVPRFAVTAGVFLAGVYWITNRREEVAEQQARARSGPAGTGGRAMTATAWSEVPAAVRSQVAAARRWGFWACWPRP